jgi:hypothetical protein
MSSQSIQRVRSAIFSCLRRLGELARTRRRTEFLHPHCPLRSPDRLVAEFPVVAMCLVGRPSYQLTGAGKHLSALVARPLDHSSDVRAFCCAATAARSNLSSRTLRGGFVFLPTQPTERSKFLLVSRIAASKKPCALLVFAFGPAVIPFYARGRLWAFQ